LAQFGAEVWEQIRLLRSDPSDLPGYEIESYDVGTAYDEIAAAGPLPDIPVTVVRRGGPAFDDDPLPDAEVLAWQSVQWDSQVQWAAGVPGAEVITVPDTGHYVPVQRPDAVVDAIRDAIARA
jgi:pimeloyl-ACP methyl ester carboxylesterase